MRHFLFSFALVWLSLAPAVSSAQSASVSIRDQVLKGFAVVRIKSKRIPDVVLQQAVLVAPESAQFVGITDFGNIAFSVLFEDDRMSLEFPGLQNVETSSKKLKRLLSLPLNKDEFLSIIRHDKPQSFKTVMDGEGEIWSNPKKKKLKIRFSDFIKLNGDVRYPQRIVVEHKDSVFDLKWQNVSLQSVY